VVAQRRPAGEPISVVLQLYTAGPSPYPKDGILVAGVRDVEVVVRGRGNGETRRFPTEDLGSGRYGTEIVFPKAGGWHVVAVLAVALVAAGLLRLGRLGHYAAER
jgi:hypothetical protein